MRPVFSDNFAFISHILRQTRMHALGQHSKIRILVLTKVKMANRTFRYDLFLLFKFFFFFFQRSWDIVAFLESLTFSFHNDR